MFARWLLRVPLAAVLLLAPATALMADRVVDERRVLSTSEPGALAGRSFDGIHFVSAGRADAPIVVLVHGTPGSWRHWRRYLESSELTDLAHLVAVDRPGWGQSVDDNGALVLPFSDQASRLAILIDGLKREHQQPVILVGHSLGASLVPRVYLDYPSLVDGMLLINGAHDPELASTRWYHHLARLWVVGRLIGADLRRANKEVFALADNLRSERSVWGKLQIPVTLMQGGRDWLVNPANVDFVSARATDGIRIKRYPDRGHFIPFRSSELVIDAIKELLHEVDSNRLASADMDTTR